MVDEHDCHKTAFLTKYSLFEHIRMAQGLCNAPATFQRLMILVLLCLACNKIHPVLVYLDGVIVLGRSFEKSLENLEVFLYRFEVNSLKLKTKTHYLLSRDLPPWMYNDPRGCFHH